MATFTPKSQTGSCRYSKLPQKNTDAGFIDVTPATDDGLMAAVANIGPISVCIDASARQFNQYDGKNEGRVVNILRVHHTFGRRVHGSVQFDVNQSLCAGGWIWNDY
jgi:hypothetical protein